MTKNEWIGVVVALAVVAAFMVFPQVLASFNRVMGTGTPDGTVPTPPSVSY